MYPSFLLYSDSLFSGTEIINFVSPGYLSNTFLKLSTIVREIGGDILADSPQLAIYTLELCPNCELLKEFLTGHGIPYRVRDMSTAESLTELRINGIFVSEAPVLQNGDNFLTSPELFSGGKVREDNVTQLVAGA
jgi:glutaredoxin